MAQRSLGKLYNRFSARTDRLLDEFLIVPTSSSIPANLGAIESDKVIENSRRYLVNRLFHLWGEFCMSVVVASAIGGYRTLRGSPINSAPGIKHMADVQRIINVNPIVGPRSHWEYPDWTTGKVTLLKPTNEQQIKLGIASVPMGDFSKVRHFVVHPNSHTRVGFKSVTRKHSLFQDGPSDLLLHRLPGGSTIIGGWIQEFQIAAHTAVQ